VASSSRLIGTMLRKQSTAAVLFHHAVAESLGLGPTDHKCFDLLRERGPMIGRELAALTGLTSGAITGVVTRLESAGYVHREEHPEDQRKQLIVASTERVAELERLFAPVRDQAACLLEGFDEAQLATISEFLARSTEFTYQQAALLRARTAVAPKLSPTRVRRTSRRGGRTRG
jgi:DNA-binding MarR family transcriptional regulator